MRKNLKLSLEQALREMGRYTSKSRARRTALMVILESFPPAFNVLLISGLAYLIFRHRRQNSSPDDLEDDEGGGSTFAAFASFSVLQIVLNWVQFLRHRSVVSISTRNFPGYVHRFPSLTTSRDSRYALTLFLSNKGQQL